MTKQSDPRWASFLIALAGSVAVGGIGMVAWQMRPEARFQAADAAANHALMDRRPKDAWAQFEKLRPVDPALTDYYEAKLLASTPELAPAGQAAPRAAQLYRQVISSSPAYADRARVALAELLLDQPALARSPDETIVALRAAAQRGNRRAGILLADQLVKRPDADKRDVLRLLTKASESNDNAAKTLINLIENSSLPVKSPHLVNDIRYRRFISLLTDAKAGQVAAMVKVGDAYRDGSGVPKSISEAGQWYDRAVALDSNTGRLRQIGLLRLEGTQASAIKAHSLALDAAKDGKSVDAIEELALDFKDGRGTPPDPGKAEAYLRKAIAIGSTDAQYELADILLHKQPEAPAANAEAFALLTQAAQAGSPKAAWALYSIIDEGQKGVVADRAKALPYLIAAAKGGSLAARGELARRYSKGDAVVAENDAEAFRWAASAIEGGSKDVNLLLIIADGYARGEVVPQDKLRAKAYLEAAVNRGSARAMRKLGALYFTLPQPDAAQNAVKWLREASKRGQTDAYIELGRAYASGAGVPVDPSRAFTFFEEAANAGDVDGLVEMARSYATGYGVAKDPAAAAELYRRASEMGSVPAMIMLSYCYENGDGVPKSGPEARAWLKRGADANDAEAQYWYGVYLLEGRGGAADRSAAIQMFEQAKTQRFKPAVAILFQIQPSAVVNTASGITPVAAHDDVKPTSAPQPSSESKP